MNGEDKTSNLAPRLGKTGSTVSLGIGLEAAQHPVKVRAAESLNTLFARASFTHADESNPER
jgi:hypothetical protein